MSRNLAFQLSAVVIALLLGWSAFHIIGAPPMTRGEVADWVQGVGSIAAVAIATWAGTQPGREEAKRTKERRAAFAQAVLRASRHANEAITLLINGAETRNESLVEFSASLHDEVSASVPLERLLSEPLTSWPSPDLYILALELKNTAETIRKGATAILETPQGDGREQPFRLVALERHNAKQVFDAVERECLTFM